MANDTPIPGLIPGHKGTIIMVPDGKFENRVEYITIVPQKIARETFRTRFGNGIEIKIECEPRETHMMNFPNCMRTRQKPVLDAHTGHRAQATISMAVQSYRESRVLYFHETTQKVVEQPPKAAKGIRQA
jgi:Oxidoreductase family, C-terminal alpha/beta domain